MPQETGTLAREVVIRRPHPEFVPYLWPERALPAERVFEGADVGGMALAVRA